MSWNTVRWVVLGAVVLGAGGGVYYQYEITRPCATPIAYAIGTVDSRFQTSDAAVIAAAATATGIWASAAGKKLFIYDPEATLKINLIYDEREATARLGREIVRQQAALDTTRLALDALQARCTSRSCDELTTRVASYNASVARLNLDVAKYNQTAGRPFEQGQYVRDIDGERINIFEFFGTEQLTRVLAHEFGHALGLDHNDDSKAIMYAKSESGSLTPTAADLSALRALCGIQAQ